MTTLLQMVLKSGRDTGWQSQGESFVVSLPLTSFLVLALEALVLTPGVALQVSNLAQSGVPDLEAPESAPEDAWSISLLVEFGADSTLSFWFEGEIMVASATISSSPSASNSLADSVCS